MSAAFNTEHASRTASDAGIDHFDEHWEPRRIIVLRALFLGDLLCATPALRALRHRFPSAEITLIGLPWAEDFVDRLPAIDRLMLFPGYPGIPEVEYSTERTEAFLAEARDAHYDLALQMHGSGNLINGFMTALGADVTMGYRLLNDDRLTVSLPYVADEPEVLRWLRLVGLLGAETDDSAIEFPTSSMESERAASLLATEQRSAGPLVGLHTGASTPLRRWPAEQFAALADVLVQDWGCRAVLTGNENERDLADRVCQLARSPLTNLAGQTDLGTFAALVGQLDLLVTNDTGASHMAAAAGTPSVVIFGTTPAHQWAPLDDDQHLIVDARSFAPPETSPIEALAQLPVEPVLLACQRHLDAGRTVTAQDRAQRP